MTKSVKTQEKSQTQGEKSGMNVFQLIKSLENFGTFCQFSHIYMQKAMIYEKNMTKSVKTQEKSQIQDEKS